MKIKIKALLFDFGGVISKDQNQPAVDQMCRLVDLPAETFLKTYRQFRPDYDSAVITAEGYWKRVLDYHGIRPAITLIRKLIDLDIQSWTDINEAALDYFLALKNVKKAIVSNMPNETLHYMKKYFTWLNDFDVVIFSCNIKSSKPDCLIFEKCLQALGLPPAECVFTDDSAANIRGAEKIGINTIRFKDLEQFKNELAENYKFN